MKAFKKRNYIKDRSIIIGCLIFFFVGFFLFCFSKYLSPSIVNISKLKINEVTTNIINDAVLNYKKSGVDLNTLIKSTTNEKKEIIAVDLDMENAYKILEDLAQEIRQNIQKFQFGEYKYYNMESLSVINNGLIIAIPLGAASGKHLIVNLGPKVPVKISFLENLKANLRTEVKAYGINNSLVNVYIKFDIEQNIEMPSAADSFSNEYEMLLSSKLIYGVVPNFYGGYKGGETEIVNIPVN